MLISGPQLRTSKKPLVYIFICLWKKKKKKKKGLGGVGAVVVHLSFLTHTHSLDARVCDVKEKGNRALRGEEAVVTTTGSRPP